MIRALSLRKILGGRSKGVSSVIGIVFLILVIFAISTNIFVWTISQSVIYNQVVRDANQKNADRFNENIIATEGNYTVLSGDRVKIEAKLTNAGSVATQIINLWVFDTTKQTYGFNSSVASMNSNMNPGEILNFTGTNVLIVAVPEANSLDKFSGWFVTARGNAVPITPTEGIIIAQVSQGIGSVGMDFGSFVYYHVDYVSGKYRLRQSEWPNGLSGYTVPKGPDIAFRVTLTNFDTNRRTIQLSSHSVLWMIFPASEQQPRGAWWYIVKVDANGIIETFATVTLSYGVPTQVFFASSTDGSFNPSSINNPISSNQPAAVNLMLLGTIDDSAFGQNIPFVSVYVS